MTIIPTYLKAKYLPVTNHKPSRIAITWLNGESHGKRKIISYDHVFNGVRDQVEQQFNCQAQFSDGDFIYFSTNEG